MVRGIVVGACGWLGFVLGGALVCPGSDASCTRASSMLLKVSLIIFHMGLPGVWV